MPLFLKKQEEQWLQTGNIKGKRYIPIGLTTLKKRRFNVDSTFDVSTTLCACRVFIWGNIVKNGLSFFWKGVFFNSFGAKFLTTVVVCFYSYYYYYFNKLSFGKTFICKVERLNVKQRRSRWDGSLSRLFWIYAVCKSYYYRLWQWKSYKEKNLPNGANYFFKNKTPWQKNLSLQ